MLQLVWIVLMGLAAMMVGLYIGVMSSGDHNAFN